jgi:hypothetical protein
MFFARFALLLAWATAAGVQPVSGPERVLGLVEIPRLSRDKGAHVVLRRGASPESAILATISSLDELETEKIGHEESAAVVYARQRDWSVLKTSAGVAGWLAPSDAGTYHSLEALLRRELVGLTAAWDRRLGTAPDAATLTRLPTDPRKRMIGYLEPTPEDAVVFLEAGEDREEMRRRFNVRDMGGTTSRDGTERLVLHLESWISAFEQPDVNSRVVSRFQSPSHASVLRGTHNQHPPDIAVFDRRPGWFQVRLKSDEDKSDWWNEPKAWIQDSVVWRFREVSDADWERVADEMWWRPDWEENIVRVLRVRDIGGTTWLEIEILSNSSCESNEPPRIKARGWIPAYAPSGAVNVWFWADC